MGCPWRRCACKRGALGGGLFWGPLTAGALLSGASFRAEMSVGRGLPGGCPSRTWPVRAGMPPAGRCPRTEMPPDGDAPWRRCRQAGTFRAGPSERGCPSEAGLLRAALPLRSEMPSRAEMPFTCPGVRCCWTGCDPQGGAFPSRPRAPQSEAPPPRPGWAACLAGGHRRGPVTGRSFGPSSGGCAQHHAVAYPAPRATAGPRVRTASASHPQTAESSRTCPSHPIHEVIQKKPPPPKGPVPSVRVPGARVVHGPAADAVVQLGGAMPVPASPSCGSGRARCRRPSARARPGRAPGTRARPRPDHVRLRRRLLPRRLRAARGRP